MASGTEVERVDVRDARSRREKPVVAHPLQDVRQRQEAERHVVAAHDEIAFRVAATFE